MSFLRARPASIIAHKLAFASRPEPLDFEQRDEMP